MTHGIEHMLERWSKKCKVRNLEFTDYKDVTRKHEALGLTQVNFPANSFNSDIFPLVLNSLYWLSKEF